MQTIIGSGGGIGKPLARELKKNYTDQIRLVSRNPRKVNDTDQLFPADACKQMWHLPTTKEKLTSRQWIQLIADELKVQAKIQTVPVWMLKALGSFVPLMKEFPEMIYQFEEDYIFDSSKFEKRFNLEATAPLRGIRSMFEQ